MGDRIVYFPRFELVMGFCDDAETAWTYPLWLGEVIPQEDYFNAMWIAETLIEADQMYVEVGE